jgi:3-hydroxyisobutyrate dehydrogenase-like beta-hydroxyacid dehydrogenase
MAAALAPLGVDFLDCPLSGGVAGARTGTLTAMAGGDPALLERVRPVLAAFATNVRWAGPTGAGHATKALNNALSAASLMATAELLVTAVRCGSSESATVAAFNAGAARSQNSEVKYPRDVLPRTYAAGFTAALMVKDLGVALRIAEDRSVVVPFLRGLIDAWREAAEAMGMEADFTRVHAVIESRAGGGPAPDDGADLDVLCRALAAVNRLAAGEAMRVAAAEGLDRERVLGIVNTSTGRSEATRSRLAGVVDTAALEAAAAAARRVGVWAPLTTLARALASRSSASQ